VASADVAACRKRERSLRSRYLFCSRGPAPGRRPRWSRNVGHTFAWTRSRAPRAPRRRRLAVEIQFPIVANRTGPPPPSRPAGQLASWMQKSCSIECHNNGVARPPPDVTISACLSSQSGRISVCRDRRATRRQGAMRWRGRASQPDDREPLETFKGPSEHLHPALPLSLGRPDSGPLVCTHRNYSADMQLAFSPRHSAGRLARSAHTKHKFRINNKLADKTN
jgi:hypothetical protein